MVIAYSRAYDILGREILFGDCLVICGYQSRSGSNTTVGISYGIVTDILEDGWCRVSLVEYLGSPTGLNRWPQGVREENSWCHSARNHRIKGRLAMVVDVNAITGYPQKTVQSVHRNELADWMGYDD